LQIFVDCEFISFAMFPAETDSPLDLRTRKRENVEGKKKVRKDY